MTESELHDECSRLFLCKTLKDSYDLIEIYLNFLFQAIKNHHKDGASTIADAEAKILLQMIFTKTLYLKKAIEGVSYDSDGSKLNKIIDPTIVASLIRNVYETIGTFSLIYINTKSDDEKTILYNLWVIAGLKYRQRFEEFAQAKENQQKLVDEKKRISSAINKIKNTELYKRLSEKDRSKIDTKIKRKDYKIEFRNNEVIFLSWQDLKNVIGCQNDFFDKIYTYFSLYAHPSNVSVFQFAEMFGEKDRNFENLTNFNLKNFFMLLSIFIADFISLFPEVLETFNILDLRDQMVIDFQNTLIRGSEAAINDSLANHFT